MSIRYQLSIDLAVRQLQEDWCWKNVPKGEFFFTRYATYVDFINDEDAIMFSIKFGLPKHSTRLSRMIAREIALENMEENRKRNTTGSGMGYPFLK